MDNINESFHIKDAVPEDADRILKFSIASKVGYFGERRQNIPKEEKSFSKYITHRFIVFPDINQNSNFIGYAEISNSPCTPALPGDCWENWLSQHYCTQLPLNPSNSIFFNTFIYNKSYNPALLRKVLNEIFMRENKVRYIIAVQYPDYGFKKEKERPDYYCLEQFSTRFYPYCFSAIACPNPERIHVICRDDIIQKMSYRFATPEDNDDVVELVDQDRPDIREVLGDYYIAEELLSESSNSILIVTEISKLTAGLIWLNGHVNVTTLLENYNMDQFSNLIRFDEYECFKEKQIAVNSAKRSPINELFAPQNLEPLMKILDKDVNELWEITNSDNQDKTNESNKKHFLFSKKLTKFVEIFRSNDHYLQLTKGQRSIFYNVPCDATNNSKDKEILPNAFAIQLIGLHENHDIRRLFRYLLAAFSAFPDCDYCLLSISIAQTMTTILLEVLKYFIRVQPRPYCKIAEDLYITHRSAIYGELTLFHVQPEDVKDIKQLLSIESPHTLAIPRATSKSTIAAAANGSSFTVASSHISLNMEDEDQQQYDIKVVREILEDIFQNPFSEYQCFIIKCGDATKPKDDNVIVGFVILRPFNSKWLLEKHFVLPYIKDDPTLNLAEIMILKLHPFFHYQADVIFRELARLANCSHFYHFRQTMQQCLSNDLLLSMQPLEPRRIKKLWFGNSYDHSINQTSHGKEEDISKNSNIPTINYSDDHYAVYQNNLMHSDYFGSTANIVILGFTDICKAFLRLFLFIWNKGSNIPTTHNCLPMVNITVICNPGIMEAEYENSFRCEICENDDDCWVNYRNCDAFVRDVTERMDVRIWIRFITGYVKSIDREKHLVKLASNCEIYYEKLLLMCSTDFGISMDLLHTQNIPSNYIQINNRYDKLLFYHRLRMFQNDMCAQPKIVIYGLHVRAFEFINFLLKHDVKGESISLVMPHLLAATQMGLTLNDSTIDIRIEPILREMIEDLNVKVYDRMNLLEIHCNEDQDIVTRVIFQNFFGDKELTFDCDFFISYHEKYIDDGFLKVLQESKLETKNSHILVNETYQTSDENIYAIGNFIKHHSEPNHQYRFVSPQEAAQKIIEALNLDQFEASSKEVKFSQPYYFQAQLPMDHFFFKITIPKRYLANHLNNEYGLPLVTYFEGDFCRVRLNEHNIVEEIVIVTKKNHDYDFCKFFCGRHEMLLNNLRSRWYLKDIYSFLDFFQEPWVALIMNDHFEELQKQNKLLMLTIAQEVMNLKVDRELRSKIMNNYCQDSGVTSQLEETYLKFLRNHRDEFGFEIALPEDFPGPMKFLQD
ncbi:cilia- and flagella-associated protein 61-like isoform X1 [Haematobia irritans]|uniref:cilia- and flagella-associated protein 61-like isoform X1 n=1 Tax=Haematobia irritans TaxID=7368 RepID=UPI003F4FC7E4